MAIKSSNQIIFSEQKKVLQINEWYLKTNKSSGVTVDSLGWSKEIQVMDEVDIYLWNYEEIIYSIGDPDISDPIIIGVYSKGTDGKGIIDIKNYYYRTQEPQLPESPKWSETVELLTPTDKYLWNYERFIYSDNSFKDTDPAIIGVYGDSGDTAVEFKIYSNQGFVFKEDVNSIELKTAAFKGSERITDASYTWSWWDSTLNNGAGGYSEIVENTDDQHLDKSSLTVYKGDQYAFEHLRCVMTYDENTYEDYVDLISETVIYSSVVKFFNGSNVFDSSSPYIVAYVDLYRNNILVDSIYTNRYYGSATNVNISDGIITTDLDEEFENGSLMYFIYSNSNRYNIVLGQYESGIWYVYNNSSQYMYINDLYHDITSNVVVISKNDIAKSTDINFTIYKNILDDENNNIYNDDTYVSTTNAIVVDINDPIISKTEPQNANYGQLWLDTSVVPYVLKIYTQVNDDDIGSWEYFVQQNGGTVYTSKPESYSEGDIWILADNETCGSFGYGSMLRANMSSTVFNASHWEDAMDIASTITNIKESFTWNDTGIQIAKKITDSNGNITTPFYVHIDSERMGFHSVAPDDDGVINDVEVVHIGNNSATIQNAIFKGNESTFDTNVQFNQQVNFGNFVWKVEANGSLSLAIDS